MTNNTIRNLVTLLLTAVFIGVILLLGFGCSTFLSPPTPDVPAIPTINTVVSRLGWIPTLSIIGMAISVAALVNGSKSALPIFIGCCTALGMALATVKYATAIAIGSAILAAGVYIYGVFIKNKAFKEVVLGGENFKTLNPGEPSLSMFKTAHKSSQSKPTGSLVDKAKVKLFGS